MIIICAGNQQIAERVALNNDVYPRDKNRVLIVTPRTVNKFRGRIIRDDDEVLWGAFPNNDKREIIEAIEIARR